MLQQLPPSTPAKGNKRYRGRRQHEVCVCTDETTFLELAPPHKTNSNQTSACIEDDIVKKIDGATCCFSPHTNFKCSHSSGGWKRTHISSYWMPNFWQFGEYLQHILTENLAGKATLLLLDTNRGEGSAKVAPNHITLESLLSFISGNMAQKIVKNNHRTIT